jgi:hypothetical protein
LVFVIDHLETPEVSEPVELVRPKVLFEFADSDLEDLSASQKLLIRIGPENAAVIKGKLREIRSAPRPPRAGAFPAPSDFRQRRHAAPSTWREGRRRRVAAWAHS